MKLKLGPLALKIAVAIVSGVVLGLVVDLKPIWWLAWIAPVPMLWLALRADTKEARWLVGLAALVAVSFNFHYLSVVMPLAPVFAILAGQALLWTFIAMTTRRVVLRYRSWWTVLVYPAAWVTADTLMAALLPDGNWASLAYSQADVLPLLQITSLFGVGGLLFLVSLVPSTLAVALACGRRVHRGWVGYGMTAVIVIASFAFGTWRLQNATEGTPTRFGLVAIDDAIGLKASESYTEKIVRQYDQHVATLAAQGAQVVVLPEKIAMLRPAATERWQQHLGALAAQHRVWLEASLGIDDGTRPINVSWLFAPDGTLAASYQKHHMAPPERHQSYAPGDGYTTHAIDGERYGLAICKDMHFASLGRAYGERQASVMLVPAWDFDYLDGWIEARTTLARGVENGYGVVRTSREGLLTISDAYGRVIAERESSAMPGATLLATLNVGKPVATLYTRIGDLFGWICVAGFAALWLLSMRRSDGITLRWRPEGSYS